MDSPVGAFQLPAQGFWRVGKLRSTESAVDQAGFFPRQRGGGWSQHFLEQLNGRGVDITRFCARNNARLWRHNLTQGTQLLLQQSHGFRDLNQHHARRLRILCGAVEELHAAFIELVVAQVLARRQLAQIGITDAVRCMFDQRTTQCAESIIQDQNRAANFCLIQLLQQIFIRRFPRLKRVNVVRFRETF